MRHNETRVNHSSTYGKFITQLLSNGNPIKKLTRLAIPRKMDYRLGELLRGINKSNRKYDPMDPAIAQHLADFYKPWNEKLSELTGMDFSSWNNVQDHT